VADARWLEVSMTVNGELAEAISDVLDRFVSNGVVIESGVKYNDAEDEGTPFGPVRIYGYLAIDEQIEERRQRLLEALYFLGRIQALPEPTFRTIEDEDWMAAWKKHYRPILIGKKLLILPAWIEREDPGRVAVKIDPSMAFGTGTHPTTQLCLAMVETYTRPGRPAIDIGCGSGILSIGALLLGANHALGVDIDAEAERASRENAEANGVADRLELGLGSVDEIRAGKFSLTRAPLVLANILAPILIRLFEGGMADLVEPGGVLVLSGILDEQSARVEAAAEAQGLTLLDKQLIGDWVALAYQK
jgi:ribosomal protein L11 methyltransferase